MLTVCVVDPVSSGVPLVEAVQARGWRCVGVSTPGGRALVEATGLPAVQPMTLDGWFDFDGVAEGPLLAWARLHEIDVVLPGCEAGVEVADRIAAALDLAGNDPATSASRRDKGAMGRALRAAGLGTPLAIDAPDVQTALAFWRGPMARRPIVIKPHRSSGCDGVHFCADEAAVRGACAALLGRRDLYAHTNASVLAQARVTGRLIEVCTISVDGVHDVVMLIETRKTGAVYDAMDLLPSACWPALAPVIDFARQTLDALGFRFGAAHVEVMWAEGQAPVCIELGARLIGLMPPALCRAASGTDQITRLVDAIDPLLPPAALRRRDRHARLVVLRSDAEGTAHRLDEIERWLSALSACRAVHLGVEDGDPIVVTRDLTTAPGFVELVGGDRACLDADHAAIRAFEAAGAWRRAVSAGARESTAFGAAAQPSTWSDAEPILQP